MRWILLAMLMPCAALGQSIENVFGFVGNDSTLTITGSEFGENGPNVLLFDNFEDETDGQSLDLDATVGDWTLRRNVWDPQAIADDDGNGMAFRAVYAGVVRIMEVDFQQEVQEVYISYRIKIPDGKFFPWSFAEETFPPGSTWKLNWLLDGASYGGGNDDWCLPTWPNGLAFAPDGNSSVLSQAPGIVQSHYRTHNLQDENTWWFSFDVWNRYSVYLKGGANPTVDNGICWQQGMSEPLGQYSVEANQWPMFNSSDDRDGSQWSYMIFPGWSRGGQGASAYGNPADYPDPGADAWYDDIYIAIGDHARARIEIGDNSNYDECDLLEICTPTSWGSEVVEATVRLSQFQSNEPAYVFVIDTDGNASEGYPVTIGDGADVGMGPPVDALMRDGVPNPES